MDALRSSPDFAVSCASALRATTTVIPLLPPPFKEPFAQYAKGLSAIHNYVLHLSRSPTPTSRLSRLLSRSRSPSSDLTPEKIASLTDNWNTAHSTLLAELLELTLATEKLSARHGDTIVQDYLRNLAEVAKSVGPPAPESN